MTSLTSFHRLPRVVIAATVGLTLVLTGCTGPGATGVDSASTTTVGTVTHTSGPAKTVTRVVISTEPASGTASGTASLPTSGSTPPSSGDSTSTNTATPTFVTSGGSPGECPYLDNFAMAKLSGQRTGTTTVIGATLPVCVFTRLDGGWLAAVQPMEFGSAEEATALVNAAAPIADSSPASRPAGWSGGYLSFEPGAEPWPEARSVYAVSKGKRAIVAWTNQAQSVKSRNIIEDVLPTLGW